jgi:hypothetical protein
MLRAKTKVPGMEKVVGAHSIAQGAAWSMIPANSYKLQVVFILI